MDAVFEFLYSLDLLMDKIDQTNTRFSVSMQGLNDSIEQTINKVGRLANVIDNLNTNLALQDKSYSIPSIGETNQKVVVDKNSDAYQINPDNTESKYLYTKSLRTGDDNEKTLKKIKTITEISDNLLSIPEHFGLLPESLKNLHTGIKSLNNLVKVGGGMEDLLSATEKTTAVMEEIGGGSEALSAAAGLAASGSFLGPGEWIVGGAIVAGAFINDLISEDSHDKKRMLNAERTEDALNTFYMNNAEVDRFINVEPKVVKSHREQDEYNKAMKKYGRYAFEPSFSIPQPQADHPHNVFLGGVPMQQDNDRLLPQKSFSDISTPIIYDLITLGEKKGMGSFNRKVNELNLQIGKNGYNKQYAEYTRSAIKIAKGHLIDESGNGYIEVGQSLPGRSSGGGFERSPSRQIVINLNKPMIDHFTINVKDTKEGVADLKRKVEEVLLAILNSANVIQ